MPTKPPPGVMDDPSHPLSRGCVCHLLFNEGAGSLAYDVSGHGNHGILKNMAPNLQGSGWGGSKFGRGVQFDGINDYADCGNKASLNIIDAITIEAWIKTSFTGAQSPNYMGIVTKGEYVATNAAYAFGIRALATPNLYLYWKAGGTYYGAAIEHSGLDDQRWHHIAGVRDSSYDLELFVDGISIGTNTNNNAPVDGGLSAKIGKGKYFFNGIIDVVRIHNRALSAEEIKQLYHDPFCNLMQVPAWQLYSPAVGGYDVSMHLTQALQITQVGAAAANSVLNLSEALSFVIAGQSTSNASITLNTGHTIVLNASAVANSTLALAIYRTLVQATGTDVDVDITLSHALAFTDIAQASASASFTLTNIASLSQTGLATAEAALSLGYNNAITNISTSVISAQLALAISAGIDTAATIAISEDISLSQNFTLQSLAVTEAEGELSLDQILALTAAGEAIATANLPLSSIQSVTITATTVDILLGDISDPTILSITVDRTFKSQTKKRSFQHTM